VFWGGLLLLLRGWGSLCPACKGLTQGGGVRVLGGGVSGTSLGGWEQRADALTLLRGWGWGGALILAEGWGLCGWLWGLGGAAPDLGAGEGLGPGAGPGAVHCQRGGGEASAGGC